MADTFERPFDSLTPEEREREKSWIIALYRAGKLPGLNLDLSDDDPMDEDQTDGGHVDGDQVDEDTDDEDQVQGPIVQNVKRKSHVEYKETVDSEDEHSDSSSRATVPPVTYSNPKGGEHSKKKRRMDEKWLTAGRPCKRCKGARSSCEKSSNPRRKACKRCANDKKTCSFNDESPLPRRTKAKRQAASESSTKTKDIPESVEDYAAVESVNSISALIEHQKSEIADLRSDVKQVLAELAKTLRALVEVKEETRAIREHLEQSEEDEE